jgi:hypothetical protein
VLTAHYILSAHERLFKARERRLYGKQRTERAFPKNNGEARFYFLLGVIEREKH